MALIVTYTSAFTRRAVSAPVEIGAMARTQAMTLTASSVAGTLSCADGENIISLYAAEACWINIGAAPVAAVNGATSRYVEVGGRLQFHVEVDQKVAGILA